MKTYSNNQFSCYCKTFAAASSTALHNRLLDTAGLAVSLFAVIISIQLLAS